MIKWDRNVDANSVIEIAIDSLVNWADAHSAKRNQLQCRTRLTELTRPSGGFVTDSRVGVD